MQLYSIGVEKNYVENNSNLNPIHEIEVEVVTYLRPSVPVNKNAKSLFNLTLRHDIQIGGESVFAPIVIFGTKQ